MMKLCVFMKISFSASQTKNCAMRLDNICDDDDDLATMLDSDDDFYVFIRQMTLTAVIQSICHDSFRQRFQKLQILIPK